MPDGSLLVEGGVLLNDLKEKHGLPVEETQDFRTIAGFLLARLARIPQGGEAVFQDSHKMTIVAMDGRRIAKVKIEKPDILTRPRSRESTSKALVR
jgi:putative hemolysin